MRVAVVTGANKGIGLSIVSRLQQTSPEPLTIYLTSRDTSRGLQALEKLQSDSGSGSEPSKSSKCDIKFHSLDICSEGSCIEFASHIKESHGGLDILVNNAAISYFTRREVPLLEQAKETLSTNYWGTLCICEHLFPLLRPQARVVNVASALGHLSKVAVKRPGGLKLKNELGNPELTTERLNSLLNAYIESVEDNTYIQEGWPNSAYSVSKIGISALTRIQQREMDKSRPNDGILVNSVHPGWVKTDLTGGKGVLVADEGAVAPTWAALIPPGAEGPKGAFIWRDFSVVNWADGPLPASY